VESLAVLRRDLDPLFLRGAHLFPGIFPLDFYVLTV